MKRAIVQGDSGMITDICDPGDEFQIYEGADANMKWCDVPDDTTNQCLMVNGVVYDREELEDQREAYIVARMTAYGSIGEQLDMMYQDQLDGGTRFRDHIATVKANTPSPSTAPVFVEDARKVQVPGRKAWEPFPE